MVRRESSRRCQVPVPVFRAWERSWEEPRSKPSQYTLTWVFATGSGPFTSTEGTRVGVGLWGYGGVWHTVTLAVRRNLRSLHHVVAGRVGSRLSAKKVLRRTAPVPQRRVVGGRLTARGHNRQHLAVLCHPRRRRQGRAGVADRDRSASGGPVGGHRVYSVDLLHHADGFADHPNDWYLLGGWGGPDAVF